MKGWGYFGFTLGGLIGLLLLLLLLVTFRPPAAPAVAPPPNTIAPDVTIFLAEQSVSRLASALLGTPTVVDFEPNGQMQ